MRKFQVLLLMGCFGCIAISSKAQDVFYSQYYANRLYLNPAFAGIGNEKRIFLNFRNQYPRLGSVYNTYTVSYDQFVNKLNGGLGFSLSNDVQGSGAMSKMSFSAMYSYQVRTGRFLSFSGGLQAGGIATIIKANDFELEDMSENLSDVTKIFPDFATGFAAFYKDSYGGISVFHLLKPYQSESTLADSRLPRKFTLFAGTYIPVYEKRLGKRVLQLNPNLIYTLQKNMGQLVYGLESLYKESYVVGIWLRQNIGLKFSALILSGGLSLDNIRLRYSYDLQFSQPSVQIPRMGANEISIIIAFGENKKNKYKTIKCPKF